MARVPICKGLKLEMPGVINAFKLGLNWVSIKDLEISEFSTACFAPKTSGLFNAASLIATSAPASNEIDCVLSLIKDFKFNSCPFFCLEPYRQTID